MPPRISSWRDGSKGPSPSGFELGQSFFGKLVQPAGGDVFLDLLVPAFGLQFGKSRSELLQFVLGQGFNRLFDLFELGHARKDNTRLRRRKRPGYCPGRPDLPGFFLARAASAGSS